MTTDLEDRIRISLRRRADAIDVTVPEPVLGPLGSPGRSRRVELAAIAAALVLFVGAALLVAAAGRHGSETVTGSSRTPGGSGPAQPVIGELGRAVDPGALVSMPAPWSLDSFTFLSETSVIQERSSALDGSERGVVPPAAFVEYRFGDGRRSVQLDFYALGTRQPQVTTADPPLVTVRGTTGWYLDYGNGRYRVQWDEGGRTWEVDGHGFASLDEVVAVLATIEWQDDATWAAGAPADLVSALAGRVDGSVSWSAAGGVAG